MIEIEIATTRVQLLDDRAVYWGERETLLIADVHFGKAAAFRAHSIAVPGGTTATDLARISALIEQCGAKSLYILGDMWHAKEGLAPQTIEVISEWRRANGSLEIVLVKGNHDRKCGELPRGLDIRTVDEPFALGNVMLAHD